MMWTPELIIFGGIVLLFMWAVGLVIGLIGGAIEEHYRKKYGGEPDSNSPLEPFAELFRRRR